MDLVNQRQFAELKGCTAEAVRLAIKDGRLKNCLQYLPGKKKPLIDPVMAAAEWEANTRHDKRFNVSPEYKEPHIRQRQLDPSAMDLAAATRLKEEYAAKLMQLKFDRESGKVVDAADVKKEAFKLARTVRDSMLNIPDRVAAEFAGCSTAAEIHMRLTDEIRQALEALAALPEPEPEQ